MIQNGDIQVGNQRNGIARWFLLAFELMLGYGVFLFYPYAARAVLGVRTGATDVFAYNAARAFAPSIILLFNIVVFFTNLDTPVPSTFRLVNKSLGFISGMYLGCYIVFLICWVVSANAFPS